jgi:His-Xaa-Ser system radical SAM maturase HxsC
MLNLPLHTRGVWSSSSISSIANVLELEEALAGHFPLASVMVDLRNSQFEIDLNALAQIGVAGILSTAPIVDSPLLVLSSLNAAVVVASGDVIRIRPQGQISVLFRRGANANSLFVTERCNSKCLMCSQPPRDEDDSWRVGEILQLIPLIDPALPVLGITGGEPTLLGFDLVRILSALATSLPTTSVHVLTNGRCFADAQFTNLFASARKQAIWAIPLYADTGDRHDFVVQAPGAFAETIHGLYELGEWQHRIEIRCVIHAQTTGRLVELAEFIYRNLSFVEHVAFMGLEPMGYARSNRDLLWVDPADYRQELQRAVWHLAERHMAVSIYNVPLCTLDRRFWPFASKSISDWKNIYATECAECAALEQCCGFFKSADASWRSRNLRPIPAIENHP